MNSQDREAFNLLLARWQFSHSNPIVVRGKIRINHDVKAFARQEVKSVCLDGFNVAEFGSDDAEGLVLDLQMEGTNVESRVDDTEAVLATLLDVKNCQRSRSKLFGGRLGKKRE